MLLCFFKRVTFTLYVVSFNIWLIRVLCIWQVTKWLLWYIRKTISIGVKLNKNPMVMCSIAIWMLTRLAITIQDIWPQAINFYLLELWCPRGVRSKHQWPCPIWNPNIWHCPKQYIVEAVCCKDCYKTLVLLNMILPQFLLEVQWL
jgi:hypothetical protein